MIILLTILLTIYGLLILKLLHVLRQFPRIDAVYEIRLNWINTNDDRYYQYSWEDMLDNYNKKTWYGIKIPKDEDFK